MRKQKKRKTERKLIIFNWLNFAQELFIKASASRMRVRSAGSDKNGKNGHAVVSIDFGVHF